MSTIVSINVSPIVTVDRDGKQVRTGIFKKPVMLPTAVEELGLAGDAQADKRFHGGPHMAVYFYPVEHYAYFGAMLGRELVPGTFGENVTVTELDEESIHIGDELEIGAPGLGESVRIAVTCPRMPCSKLAMVMESTEFVKTFLQSGRLGWYGRVVRPGVLRVGDQVRVVHRDPAGLSVRALAKLSKNPRATEAELRNAANAASMHPGWKSDIHERLEELTR